MRKTPIMAKAAALLAFFAMTPIGANAGTSDIDVENAWSRASIGTARPGVAYMDIRNAGDDPVSLVGLRTDVSGMPEIHRTSTDGSGVSSMAPAGDVMIGPGEVVALEPGGLHAMLMRLQAPLREGDSFALQLLFSDGSEVTVMVPILGIAARGPNG